MPNLGPTELIILAVLVILLFGSKKLPDAARSIGRSLRIFKSEVKEMNNDDAADIAAPRQIEQAAPTAQVNPTPVQQTQPNQNNSAQ